MNRVDLRSDTVTHPSAEMREAMYRAEVGDDVYGEDPTVIRLQELAAERTGKEAALFVASGTMGNLLAMLTHCGRGEQLVAGDKSHVVLHEQGGMSALGGIFPRTVKNQLDGTLPLEEIEAVITTGDDDHECVTRLLCLENTWNGRVLSTQYMSDAIALAHKHALRTHLDGARVFNAAIALGKPVHAVTEPFDSIQFCCSKGLAAPVGSLLCGNKEFIARARRNRKLVGGGMRQAGVIAAACIVAIEKMVDRLAEDHANARAFAEGLADCADVVVDLGSVESNMVIFRTTRVSAPEFVAALEKQGVLTLPLDQSHVRAVMHYGIERKDVDAALAAVAKVTRTKTARV